MAGFHHCDKILVIINKFVSFSHVFGKWAGEWVMSHVFAKLIAFKDTVQWMGFSIITEQVSEQISVKDFKKITQETLKWPTSIFSYFFCPTTALRCLGNLLYFLARGTRGHWHFRSLPIYCLVHNRNLITLLFPCYLVKGCKQFRVEVWAHL